MGTPLPGCTVAVEPDIARIAPSVILAASAIFCACVRASESRSGSVQVCDCCKGTETWVPAMEKDIVMPLLFLAMLCCNVVSVAVVSFSLEMGTGRANTHCRAGGGIPG